MNKLLEVIVNFIIDRSILWPFYFPIIYSMKEVRVKNANKSNGITILALNTSRFRDDLEILAKSGFKVLLMPYGWQNRVFYAYSFKDRNSKDQFRIADRSSTTYRDRMRLRKYLSYLLKAIFVKKQINCVISAGLFYNQDFDWGAVSAKMGWPYIVFHRENLIISKHSYDHHVRYSKEIHDREFFGGKVVFHNEIMKSVYVKYSGINVNKIYSFGALRMDKYLYDIKSKKNKLNNNCVTLFSFRRAVGISKNYRDDFSWNKLHDDVHTSFIELAIENPKIDFIIKHKDTGWKDTEELLIKLNALSLKNLIIYNDSYSAHDIILKSDLVTGFCSTTLLESAIAGKPVVVPFFGEAKHKKYEDFLCFSDQIEIFDIAKSKNEYKTLLIEKIGSSIPKKVMRLRELQFEKLVSSLEANAVKKYSELIVREVTNSNGFNA